MSKSMEYRKHRIEYLKTTVEYSLFGGEGETKEAHLMFHVDPEGVASCFAGRAIVCCLGCATASVGWK